MMDSDASDERQVRLTAVMKTDIRGFTERTGRLSKSDLAALLKEHETLAGAAFRAHGGRIVKGEGDAFWVVFPSVTAAVQAALQLQEELRLAQGGATEDERLAVRIVITAGDVLHLGGDIYGPTVNLAARIEAVTPADETYLSQTAVAALGESEVRSTLVGQYEFKGFEHPQLVYRAEQRQRIRIHEGETVLVTDISGIPMLFDELRDAPEQALQLLQRLFEDWESWHAQMAVAHGGKVRQIIGDACVCTFAKAEDALSFYDALRARFAEHVNRHREYASCGFQAGADSGIVLQFRTSIFGPTANTAMECERIASRGSASRHALVVTDRVQRAVDGTPWQERLELLPVEHSGPSSGRAALFGLRET